MAACEAMVVSTIQYSQYSHIDPRASTRGHRLSRHSHLSPKSALSLSKRKPLVQSKRQASVGLASPRCDEPLCLHGRSVRPNTPPQQAKPAPWVQLPKYGRKAGVRTPKLTVLSFTGTTPDRGDQRHSFLGPSLGSSLAHAWQGCLARRRSSCPS